MTITESKAQRQAVENLTPEIVEALGKEHLTADDLECIQYKIDAHQETIDQEIADYGSAEDGSPLSFYQGYRDVWDQAEDVMRDPDADPKDRKQAKACWLRCMRLAIKLGVYRPMTDQEYKEAYIFGGSKAQAFPKVDGVHCDFIAHPKE